MIFCRLFSQLCLQSSLLVLIARLAQQCEHILLIAFNARLVERIYAQQIAGNSAGLFEEVDQIAQLFSDTSSTSRIMFGTPPSVCASTTPSSALRFTTDIF